MTFTKHICYFHQHQHFLLLYFPPSTAMLQLSLSLLTQLTRMAQDMPHEKDHHDHLYFQMGHSEELLSPRPVDWHQPYYNLSSVCHTLENKRDRLHDVSHHIVNNMSFQNRSLVDKRPILAHRLNHSHPLGRLVPTDRALQFNQAEELMRRQSSSTYQKPHLKRERLQVLNQQQRHCSELGMRAVFLGSRMGPRGTGVFLPRTCTGNYTEQSHTKPSCSTVLIPARVAQALMVHFDKMESRSSRQGCFPPVHGGRSGLYHFQQKSQPQVAAPAAYDYDSIGFPLPHLPQEWMY